MANIGSHIDRVLRGRCSSSKNISIIFLAIGIDIVLTQMLTTECTYQLKLLKLITIPIYKSGPLIHLISCLFIKLILEIVILFLQFLRELPYNIVLELQKLSLLFVMIHQNSSLSKLSWQIVWKHIDFNLEMFCAGILDVVIQLSILVKKLKLIRSKGIQTLRLDLTCMNFILVSACNLFHSHKDLINSCDVFLDFSNIMLQYCKFDSLSRPESLHDSSILISDILFNDSLNRFNLIESMIQPNYLSNELSSLGDQALMNSFIHAIKTVSKCIIYC